MLGTPGLCVLTIRSRSYRIRLQLMDDLESHMTNHGNDFSKLRSADRAKPE